MCALEQHADHPYVEQVLRAVTLVNMSVSHICHDDIEGLCCSETLCSSFRGSGSWPQTPLDSGKTGFMGPLVFFIPSVIKCWSYIFLQIIRFRQLNDRKCHSVFEFSAVEGTAYKATQWRRYEFEGVGIRPGYALEKDF